MRPQPGFTPSVAELGSGPRRVLALHCTMAFSGAWKGLSEQVGDQITLIAPDMPSHGRSADWDEQSSFADTVYAASLACLTGRMDIIGHSFGAATALRLAVEHPALVRSLTLFEPVFFCAARLADPTALDGREGEAGPLFALLKEGKREEAARTFNRAWSEGPRWADIPEQVRAAMTRAVHVVPDTAAFLYEDSANLLPRLARATCPALVLRGQNSQDIVAMTNAGLVKGLPHAREAVIAEAGHMAPITHPEDLAALWMPFLAGVE